jgi:type I restriction enzyme M protein
MATLQNKTFYGKEIKSLAYIIGIMNMILHGIEAPNIRHMDTLAQNINDIQEKDRYNVVLANPPFGAGIGREIQQNFPIKSGETGYLFIQHFIKSLKAGGRAGIIIKNTFLTNGDARSLRSELFKSCDVHTVLDLPSKVFTAGVKTVVLFFEKGRPTKKVWFYQLNLKRNLGKTNPLNEADLAEFVKLQKTKADSPNSWSIDVSGVDHMTFDLSVKNPNKTGEVTLRSPEEIIKEMDKLDTEIKSSILSIKKII